MSFSNNGESSAKTPNGAQKLYAVTVFGYKKEGMSEEEYHEYISKTHAGHLKALLAREDIVSYTMVRRLFPSPLSFSVAPTCLFFPPKHTSIPT